MSKRIVIALGGNALGNTAAQQLELVSLTAKPIVDLIAAGNEVIIAHGNGPQVGMINLGLSTAAEAGAIKSDMPFPECGAMSQGYIGYHLQNAIGNELTARGLRKDVATVVTQVLVDENDPAFQHPTKPIGSFYDKVAADRIMAQRGCTMVEDAGRGWRQVVPSPKPVDVIEKNTVRALVDSDDVHCLMIGASGVGKTEFFLYPNLEYASASGMSYLALDTKGDLARNYGAIASRYYGYKVSVIDLRNPTRSDGFNFLTLMNHYMDIARKHPENLAARARAEKYAKILAKTIINPDGDAAQYGENAFFYDSAEGLLTAIVLLLAEFAPPKDGEPEKRHIVSAFKLVQDLLAVPKSRGKNGFQLLMDELPPEHKARWLAGAALTSADQSMASVMSTVMSRLNAFLDTELEQVICYDSPINAEMFASEKCAIFLILPEEDPAKNFIAALMIQNLSRELFSVADETGGRLKNRVVLFCDELGTMPPFDILPLFSAGRSRRLTLVPIIQSLAQLEKNYGKEGAEIICDNCQDTIFGGFAPQSKTAEALSSALGSRTVLSGSVSQGKESSQSLQMMERALMTPDELKSIPKGEFVVMKTGTHPMRTKLRLFLDWGITFDPDGYRMPERAARKISYVDQGELVRSIHRSCTKNPYNMEGSR